MSDPSAMTDLQPGAGEAAATWSGPDAVVTALQRLHARGAILREYVGEPGRSPGSAVFPLRIPLARPGRTDVADRLGAVVAWSRSMIEAADRGGWRVETRRVGGTGTIGAQQVPWFAHVDAAEQALEILGPGAERQGRQFRRAMEQAVLAGPWATQVCLAKPLEVLAIGGDWADVLAVAAWLTEHPRPGIPARMLPIPGVHTKVIERHEGLLARLLDLSLPSEQVDQGATTFAGRYGLAERVRTVTVAGPGAMVGLPHLEQATVTWPVAGLAGLDPSRYGISEVVIVENLAALAIVTCADGRLTIWGAGNSAADLISGVPWLHGLAVAYFGDLDSHGFAILDAVRGVLPHAVSVCMDPATVAAHLEHRVTETVASTAPLERLTEAERAALAALGPGGRIEQERIDPDLLGKSLRMLQASNPII